MIYLILSILSSAILTVIFKSFPHFKVNTFQAIVMNYMVCVTIGLLLTTNNPFIVQFWNHPWFPYAVGLGILFISGFYLIAITAQHLGITIATVSTKLSMVIPVIFAFSYFNETITILKVTGIIIALIAVYLTAKKEDSNHKLTKLAAILLPVFCFIISGVVDSILKFLQATHLHNYDYNEFLVLLFGTAAILGIPIILFNLVKSKVSLNPRSLVGGIALGIPNYGSIYFLIKTLDLPGWESSVIFPINNIGILGLATLFAYAIFREHLSKFNIIGIILAGISIGMITISV